MATRLGPSRWLGKTGVQVPLIGYGTAPLGKLDKVPREEGVRCLHHAIDHGITYLDTSPDYGSEPVVGEVMRTRRKEVFLATKINKRRKESVLDEIKASLEKLQTDHVDLIQVHAINAFADLEQALADDGACAGLMEARDQGLVRYIGITGHARPEVLAQGLRQWPFDTVLVALGIADKLVSAPDLFLLPVAQEKNAGVIAMKVFAHGEIKDRQQRELALRYSLGLPGVSLAILGMDSIRQIDENVSLAASYQPLAEEEEQRLINEVKPIVHEDGQMHAEGKNDAKSGLFWLHDTAVMGWKEKDEPYTVAY